MGGTDSAGSRGASSSGGALWRQSGHTGCFGYIAGHRLLGEFVNDEADRAGYSGYGHALYQLRRTQEALLERLTAAIAREYRQERERMERSPEQWRRELVQKLLAGEPVNTARLDYALDVWHLGVIATGTGAEKTVRFLANGLGRELLSVACGEGTVWAWIGGRRKLAITDVERQLSGSAGAGVPLAVGEPRQGIDGWRLTHREAQAALPVALSRPQAAVRCANVPLEAALLRHEFLARVLVENLFSPLDSQKDRGTVLRATLRAYFDKECNAAKAGVALNVDRHTVGRRLRTYRGGARPFDSGMSRRVRSRAAPRGSSVTPSAKASAPSSPWPRRCTAGSARATLAHHGAPRRRYKFIMASVASAKG